MKRLSIIQLEFKLFNSINLKTTYSLRKLLKNNKLFMTHYIANIINQSLFEKNHCYK